ncbi:helix-turn-helix domain-containing protein [Pedobacter sp. MC2016-15]|uniref:helix-turn-helix domain-containing protein n=1 Tax=Pedobacter sp. MC2016-15 TaxID=2994473 RepID=UPI0022477B58|nr:helix-turn-helix domain-containing protein [Pedobacter sp. MC2016-15]MCX2477997.1 helix-turn-helix domain-containing protein [Pedobacter sp. MC2016-15]
MSKNLHEMVTDLTVAVADLSILVRRHLEAVKYQEEIFLRTNDVADILKVSLRTIQRYVRRGIIKAKKVGDIDLYSKSDVFALLYKL